MVWREGAPFGIFGFENFVAATKPVLQAVWFADVPRAECPAAGAVWQLLKSYASPHWLGVNDQRPPEQLPCFAAPLPAPCEKAPSKQTIKQASQQARKPADKETSKPACKNKRKQKAKEPKSQRAKGQKHAKASKARQGKAEQSKAR
jgi:hypothetical protein